VGQLILLLRSDVSEITLGNTPNEYRYYVALVRFALVGINGHLPENIVDDGMVMYAVRHKPMYGGYCYQC
jgi:hypothetical protein